MLVREGENSSQQSRKDEFLSKDPELGGNLAHGRIER